MLCKIRNWKTIIKQIIERSVCHELLADCRLAGRRLYIAVFIWIGANEGFFKNISPFFTTTKLSKMLTPPLRIDLTSAPCKAIPASTQSEMKKS